MGKWMRIVLFVTVLGLVATPAFCAQKTYKIDGGKSHVRFEARALWHWIHGTAPDFAGTLTLDDAGPAPVILRGLVKVEAGALNTRNAYRDRLMHQMLYAQDCPEILYQITGWRPIGTPGKEGEHGILKGHLIIRAVDRAVDIPATLQKKGGLYYLEGATQVSLNEFELVPHSPLDLFRVADKVKVRFDVALSAEAPSK